MTLDRDKRVFRDGSIAIEGNRIVEIGKTADLRRKYSAGRLVDAKHKLVLPGFINAHTHCQTFTTLCRGIGVEALGDIYARLMPMKEMTPDKDRYYLAMACILGDLHMGVTTEADQDFGEANTARAIEETGMRARLAQYIYSLDLQETQVRGYTFSPEVEKKTLANCLQFVQDFAGRADGRIACDLAPHAPDSCTSELLVKVREEANRRHTRVTIHLAQSEREVREVKSRRGKTPVEYLRDTGILGPDCYAAHCVYVTEEDIRILAKTDTKICHCPSSFAGDGVSAPLIQWLRAGCTVAIALDGYADIIREMQIARIAAAFRNAMFGQGDGLTAQRLLEMTTIDAAKVIGMEKQIGSLEPGKKADIILVDMRQPHLIPSLDPVANLVYFGKGSDVETVIIDGRIVVENRTITTTDEQEMLRHAQEAGERACATFNRAKRG